MSDRVRKKRTPRDDNDTCKHSRLHGYAYVNECVCDCVAQRKHIN